MSVLKKVAGVLLVSAPLWSLFGLMVYVLSWDGIARFLWFEAKLFAGVIAVGCCVKFGMDLLKSKEVEP